MRAAILIFAAALLALAGCEQLPQPFQPKKAPDYVASRIAQSRIAVLPPQAEGGSQALPGNPRLAAETLAQALQDEGLLASPGHASEKMRRLKTVVRLIDGGGGKTHETVEVEWTLFDPNGFQIDNTVERFTLLSAAWDQGNPRVLEEVAAVAAPRIAAFLQGPEIREASRDQPETEAEAKIPAYPGARLVVLPVEGAPGDGGERLRQELERQLSLAGYPTADSPATGDLVVRGRVEVAQLDATWEEVTLVWRLQEAGRTSTLGEISQANRVPAGSLDRSWGTAAAAAAQGAADGLFDLLERIGGD